MSRLIQEQFVSWCLLFLIMITLFGGLPRKIPLSLFFALMLIFAVGNFLILNRYFSLPDRYGKLFWNYLSILTPFCFLLPIYTPPLEGDGWRLGALSVFVFWITLFELAGTHFRDNLIANSYFDYVRTYWGIVAVCYLTLAEILIWSLETGKYFLIILNLLLAFIILLFQAIPSRLHFVVVKYLFPMIALEGIYLYFASFFFPSFGLRMNSLLFFLIQVLLHDRIWTGARIKRWVEKEAVLGKGRFKRIFLKSSMDLPSYFYLWESESPFLVYIPEFFKKSTKNEVDIFISLRKKVLPEWKPVIICADIDKDVKEYAESQGILVKNRNLMVSNSSSKTQPSF